MTRQWGSTVDSKKGYRLPTATDVPKVGFHLNGGWIARQVMEGVFWGYQDVLFWYDEEDGTAHVATLLSGVEVPEGTEPMSVLRAADNFALYLSQLSDERIGEICGVPIDPLWQTRGFRVAAEELSPARGLHARLMPCGVSSRNVAR